MQRTGVAERSSPHGEALIGRPTTSRQHSARQRPHVIGELAVVLALLVVYDRLRAHAAVHTSAAVSHGWGVLNAERALHWDVERAVNTWLTRHDALRLLAVGYYQFLHVTVALT